MADRRTGVGGYRCNFLLITVLTVALSSYVQQVLSYPVDVNSPYVWTTYPRRNIAALAKNGYLKNMVNNFKRSVSTLAKNGQLPTFRSPYNEQDDSDHEGEDSHEKRNIASIARLRSYATAKRNIQALARDGLIMSKTGHSTQQNDKRYDEVNENNSIQKKSGNNEDEYYFPFYQKAVPPLTEYDAPMDYNDLYDQQQSYNPDMMPSHSQLFRRDLGPDPEDMQYNQDNEQLDANDWYLKRGSLGMPMHGLLRTSFMDTNMRNKRYLMTVPGAYNKDVDDNAIEEKRSVDDDDEIHENFVKRHIGSLARLGLLPSFRFSGGRYSRSGRARLMVPNRELYRKYTPDENFGVRKYITAAEVDSGADAVDAELPAEAVPPHAHPTGRILRRPLSNDIPAPAPRVILKTRWPSSDKDVPRFFHRRSSEPRRASPKRYLLLPAVDNIMLRKTYPNSSLPNRRKNQ